MTKGEPIMSASNWFVAGVAAGIILCHAFPLPMPSHPMERFWDEVFHGKPETVPPAPPRAGFTPWPPTATQTPCAGCQ